MASKVFLYLIGLSTALLLVMIVYETPKVASITLQVTLPPSTVSTTSTTLPTTTSSVHRRIALFSSSIHSEQRSYIFYTPITAAAWQRLGYDVIVVFTGDFTTRSNASQSPQLQLARTLLHRLGVQIIDFQCDMSYSIKMSQLVRIFGGFLPDTIASDADYILTTDSDIIPMKSPEYELAGGTDGFIYNAFCCGWFNRRNRTQPMYPMSHICLPKRIWRALFLESEQRQELLHPNSTSYNASVLSAQASFSFETASAYIRHEFGALYDSNMIKGDSAWYMDQVYVSMLLNDYTRNHPAVKIDKRDKKSKRLDSSLPHLMWEPSRLDSYGDAHVIHDEIFDSFRYVTFRMLVFFLFKGSLAVAFDSYYKEFTLTLRDRPEDH